MANKVDCSICCESVTKLQIVSCLYCEENVCKTCTKRYLLESSQDPHCMGCRRVWNRDFLIQSLPKTWVDKDLKKHREEVLFDREKSMLPATQPAVERAINRKETNKQIQGLLKQKANLKKQLRDLDTTIHDLQQAYYRGETFVKSEAKTHFTRKCPQENCKGFLSSSMKCGICESTTCKDCNEIIEDVDEHECDEEAVATMKLINKDTKPCPSCGTMIHKVSGCNQMWCPDCQNAFDWRTGNVERGVIHNPHYYQYMQNNPDTAQRRNHGDFECGGMPNPMVTLWSAEGFDNIRHCYRMLMHIQAVELGRYRVNQVQNNEGLRVMYMMNELPEKEFKTELQKKEKQRQKHQDIYDIFQMVHTTGAMYMRELSEIDEKLPKRNEVNLGRHHHYYAYTRQAPVNKNLQLPPRVNEIVNELGQLRLYANTAMEQVSKRYSRCKTPKLSDDWDTFK